MNFKSGYVAIVGKPNVGKSTLMNAILGEKLCIVSHKAQTTRHKITGILSSKDSQIVFLDTPGYHKSKKSLNQVMNEVVDGVIHDADIICLLVEADSKDTRVEKELFQRIGEGKALLIINKSDLVGKDQFKVLAEKYRDNWGAKEAVILSAKNGDGVKELVEMIKERLPEGPAYFPEDLYTDHSMRFIVSETIREELFLQLAKELPYSSAVVIDKFEEPEGDNGIARIYATIVVEKQSQKAVVIGKSGNRIKSIGSKARIKIEEFVGHKVYLELFVKVEKNWTKDMQKLREYGYSES